MPVGFTDHISCASSLGTENKLGTNVETDIKRSNNDRFSKSQLIILLPVNFKPDVTAPLIKEYDLINFVQLVQNHCSWPLFSRFQLGEEGLHEHSVAVILPCEERRLIWVQKILETESFSVISKEISEEKLDIDKLLNIFGHLLKH